MIKMTNNSFAGGSTTESAKHRAEKGLSGLATLFGRSASTAASCGLCLCSNVHFLRFIRERALFSDLLLQDFPWRSPSKILQLFFFGELIYILRFRFTPLDISLNQGSALSVDRFNSTVSLLGSQSVVLSLQACLSNRDTIKSPQNYNMLTCLKFRLAIVN